MSINCKVYSGFWKWPANLIISNNKCILLVFRRILIALQSTTRAQRIYKIGGNVKHDCAPSDLIKTMDNKCYNYQTIIAPNRFQLAQTSGTGNIISAWPCENSPPKWILISAVLESTTRWLCNYNRNHMISIVIMQQNKKNFNFIFKSPYQLIFHILHL